MSRKRLPDEIHHLRGTFQPSRHRADVAPGVTSTVPDCPEWLSDAAKEAWRMLLPSLTSRRILSASDGPALAVLAETLAEWRALTAEVADEGRTYEVATKSGGIMHRANPKCAMLSDAARRLSGCLSAFGLTPADRGKVASLPDSKPNVFRLLNEARTQ